MYINTNEIIQHFTTYFLCYIGAAIIVLMWLKMGPHYCIYCRFFTKDGSKRGCYHKTNLKYSEEDWEEPSKVIGTKNSPSEINENNNCMWFSWRRTPPNIIRCIRFSIKELCTFTRINKIWQSIMGVVLALTITLFGGAIACVFWATDVITKRVNKIKEEDNERTQPPT